MMRILRLQASFLSTPEKLGILVFIAVYGLIFSQAIGLGIDFPSTVYLLCLIFGAYLVEPGKRIEEWRMHLPLAARAHLLERLFAPEMARDSAFFNLSADFLAGSSLRAASQSFCCQMHGTQSEIGLIISSARPDFSMFRTPEVAWTF